MQLVLQCIFLILFKLNSTLTKAKEARVEMEHKRVKCTRAPWTEVHPRSGIEYVLRLQNEERDFVVLMQELAFVVFEPARVFRKHIESATHFVTMCAEPSLLAKDRKLLDLLMMLYMVSNLHPKDAEKQKSRMRELDDCTMGTSSGIYDQTSRSPVIALGIMVRNELQRGGFDANVVQTIAQLTAKLFASFKKELEGEIPSTVEGYIRMRRESVAVPWWINLQLALLGCHSVSEEIVNAASDAVWLINDAVSLERDQARGNANILLNYLEKDSDTFLELFTASLCVLDDEHHGLLSQNLSLEAEVVFASVAGNSAVYALMEKYNGWRYQWTSELQLLMRDISRKRCVEWTRITCKHLHSILEGWGIPRHSEKPEMMLIPTNSALRDPLMTVWIGKDNEVAVPNADVTLLKSIVQAEVEWWIQRCGLGSPSTKRLVVNHTASDPLEARYLSLAAVIGVDIDLECLRYWLKTLVDAGETLDDINILVVCDIIRALKSRLTEQEQIKTTLWLLSALTRNNKLPTGILASVARVVASDIHLGADRTSELRALLLRAVHEMEPQISGIQDTVNRAMIKHVCGLDFELEAMALQGLLVSSRIALEPLSGLVAIAGDALEITSSSLTTLMGYTVVLEFYRVL